MRNYFPSNSFREPNEALVLRKDRGHWSHNQVGLRDIGLAGLRGEAVPWMVRFGTRETASYGQLLYWLLSSKSAVVQSRFSQMMLASVHMAFGSVLGHWDLGQSNVISCHLGKALSILFSIERALYYIGRSSSKKS
ncbi:unnamed protein product [Prunus armeniaca]